MADVMPRDGLGGDSRGQLFLITALTIAVLMVGLALTLNTAIYTENVATRTTDTQLDDAASFERAVVSGGGKILDGANRDGGDVSTIESRFDQSVTNWSVETATLEGVYGHSTNVSPTGTTTPGARVYQTDPTQNFTNAANDSTWVAVADEEVRNARFNVSRPTLAGNSGDAFRVVVDDDAGFGSPVEVAIHDDGTNVVVTVENETGVTQSCSVEPRGADDSVVVDVTGGTVGPSRCLALDALHEDLDGEVHVRFENGDEAHGTYEFYTTTSVTTLLTSPNYVSDPSDGSPVATDAVYDATVRFVFDTAETRVVKTIRLAPGEIE